MPPSLDHLILFLPPSPSGTPTIPPSLSKAFTLTPGGTHADNLTSNTLILLADGCYIELICFLPQPPSSTLISSHWWGPSPHRRGWTDWCLTTTDSTTAEQNFENLKNVDAYEKPVEGGRKRPDGKDVKWCVTFPKGGQRERGLVPFFCHDVTRRDVRTESEGEGVVHPSGVLGVRSLTVVVEGRAGFQRMERLYGQVLGREGVKKDDNEVEFEIGRVVGVDQLTAGPKIVLREARSEQDLERVRERGFWFGDVVLGAVAGEGVEVGSRERIDLGEDDVGGVWIEYVAGSG